MGYLHVFDLDGTLVVNPEFYKSSYSGSLEQLIIEVRGNPGLAVLASCRQHYRGRGELALPALDIPFAMWRERLSVVSTTQIVPQPEVVEAIRALPGKKAVYTGSPRELTLRLLSGLGFDDTDFDLIVAWEETEMFPLKWSRSPLIFRTIMKHLDCDVKETWSVGDSWEADLAPAQQAGISTVQIGTRQGHAQHHFPDVIAYAKHFCSKMEVVSK